MVTIPLLTGISPTKWWHALNIMLEKVAGNCTVEKLHIIMLFKADFNNNNKLIGQAVMQNVEWRQEIALEQYEYCNNKAASTQCLSKRLFYNYIQAMRIPAALCSNDAKSCYDQMIFIMVALCLCCLGAPMPATKSMIVTLAQLWHHVCSAFGNSTQSQGQQEWPDPVAGIGQGNGAGPQLWAAVSIPLFEILCQEGFLATIICVMLLQQQTLGGFAFVNDMDLMVTDSTNTIQAVTNKMQGSLKLWHSLLKATGSDLVLEKCFWFLIDFNFTNNHWQYHHWNKENQLLQIPNKGGTQVTILLLQSNEAQRTLGIWLAPDGNNDEEYKYLLGISQEWHHHMSMVQISQAAMEFSLCQVLLPNICYPLIAMTFTEAQCQNILKP